jgi:TP901 family phage tail tape measure protein
MAGDNDVRIRVRADDETRQGFNSAQQNADRTAGGIGGAFEKLGGVGAAATAALTVGLAAAAAAAALLTKALGASIERANIGAKIAAQLGDTEHAAEWGKTAGELYADNFGESLADAGNAVRDVFRNRLIPEDAGDEAIKKIAAKVLTVGTIAEASSAEVSRSVHKMLVTGLAGSAEEALDILTRGFQNGANEAEDLLDTFDEYSIQFKELGISGKEALGLISQGLKAGARDADTVADALKELAIRAQDGSKGSLEAFKSLGLNGKQLSTMFASGGTEARKALDMVIDKTKLIKDPMERNAIAVGLFGTKAEDLQDALFGLDLDTAAAGLGNVAGAADRASDALGKGLGPALETFKRKAQQAFADLGDEIAPVLMGLFEGYQKFADDLGGVFEGSEVPDEVMDALRQVAHDYLPALREGLSYVTDKVRENKGEFEAVGRVLAEYVIPAIGFLLVNGVKAAVIAFGGLIETFSFLINAGTAVRNFALNMALTFANAFDMIVTTAARAFSWVPGLGPKLDAAAKEVHEFVNKVNNELKNIRDEDVYVRTHFVGGQGQSRGGDYATGGITGALSYAATGGARGGLVKVGESGSEFIRTPTGSMVYPHANTAQMEAMADQGGGMRVVLEIVTDGTEHGAYLADQLAKTVRSRGGNVQLAITGKAA